jgi:hypothetical protein
VSSHELTAAYLRIEPSGALLQEHVGDTGFVPLRGKVGFCSPKSDVTTLATWVPSFSPPEVAGMPPERASLPAARTDIPLCTLRDTGAGKVMFLAYEPSRLIREYALQDFYSMIKGYVQLMLGDDQTILIEAPQRVLASVFRKENKILIHLINGIGQRPLQETIPCHGLKLQLKLGGRQVTNVATRIESNAMHHSVKNDVLTIDLSRLDIWNMLAVELA